MNGYENNVLEFQNVLVQWFIDELNEIDTPAKQARHAKMCFLKISPEDDDN